MYEECLIEFDCRKKYAPEIEVQSYGEENLVNPSVSRVLGMHHWRWYSATNLPGNDRTAPDYLKLPIPWGLTTPEGFWYDLKELRRYLQDNTAVYHGDFCLMAFTRVKTPELKLKGFKEEAQSSWPCLSKLDSVRGSDKWTLLGYDVEGIFAHDGIGRQWRQEEYQQLRRNLWGAKLNDNHLFSTPKDASQYATWHLSQEPGIRWLFVFGLYLVEELSKPE
jgi:hypothetical protein